MGFDPTTSRLQSIKRVEGERSKSTELKGQREPFLALINLGDYSLSSFLAYFQINLPNADCGGFGDGFCDDFDDCEFCGGFDDYDDVYLPALHH